MKQRIFIILFLATLFLGINITPVVAKSAGAKCATDSKCQEYCSYTKGYQGLTGDDQVLNYTVKIYKHTDGKNWIVYAKNDEGRVVEFSDKDKWSDVFTTADKIKAGHHVYIIGMTEEDMNAKTCPQHVFINVERGSGNTIKIDNLCFDNDNRSCEKLKPGFWNWTNRFNFSDDTGDTYVVSENGESVSRYEKEKVYIKEPDIHSDDDGCSGIFGDVITNDINTALKYIKYLGPILVIVYSIMDFIKAVASGKSEEFSKAWKRFLTRIIVAILLFFVVDLVKVMFSIFGITVPESCLK